MSSHPPCPRPLLHVLLVGLLFSLPAFAEDEDEEGVVRRSHPPTHLVRIPSLRVLFGQREGETVLLNERSEERWPLKCGPGTTGELVLRASIIPGGSCPKSSVDQSVAVHGPDGRTWLDFNRDVGEWQPPLPAMELECREGTLRVRWGRSPVIALKPRPEGGLSLEPSLERELWRRLSAPTRGRVEEARHLEAMVFSLAYGGENQFELLDRLHRLATLYRAREQVAAGDWSLDVEKDLRWFTETPGVAWPELVERARLELRVLAERRQRSQPLRALEPLHLEALAYMPELAPSASADLFWEGRALCVLQKQPWDDSGAQAVRPHLRMHCYDVPFGHWGETQPARAPEPVHAVSFLSGGCGGVCSSGEGTCVELETGTAIASVGDGQRLLMARGGKWHPTPELEWRSFPDRRSFSPKEVSAVVARGAGGPVLGGGRYLATGDEDVFVQVGPTPWGWHLFSAPPSKPENGRWERVVFSPDQEYVAAVSQAFGGGPYHLWVARVVPAQKVRGRTGSP